MLHALVLSFQPMPQHLLRIAIFLALAISANAHARTYVIEYHGDSTVWGFASGSEGLQVARPAPQVFADSLGARVRVKVRNHGVNGATACALLEGAGGAGAVAGDGDEAAEQLRSWADRMRASPAHFVILNHAINDQWKYDVATYGNCLRALAHTARAHGKRVVFETPNPTRDSGAGGLDAYVEAMREVALQEKVPVIDQYVYLSRLLQGRSLFMLAPDGLHPSEATYVLKGRFAAQAFVRLFGL
jgi:lysophospholipase L1-like esterase